MKRNRLSLTPAERQVLKDSHFLGYEIYDLSHALTGKNLPQKIDLSSEAWQAVIRSREKWYQKFIDNGGNHRSFARVLRDFYSRQKEADRTPFIWLRIEYGRHISAQKTDYQAAKAARKTRKELKGFWWKA
jgi:hypothetical protein